MKKTLILSLRLVLFLTLALLCSAFSFMLIMLLMAMEIDILTPVIILLDGLLPLAAGVGLFLLFDRVIDKKWDGQSAKTTDQYPTDQSATSKRRAQDRKCGGIRHIGQFACGSIWGAACVAVGLGVILSVESMGVVLTQMPVRVAFLLSALGMFLCSGLFEELIFRGYILRKLLISGTNKYMAVAISAIIFSVGHILNNAFTPLPFINILLAGILLGFIYIYTGNLYMVTGFHAFFNYAQSTLGFAVSGGSDMPSLFMMQYTRATIINGGEFGFEGSVICSAVMIVCIGVAMIYGKKKGAAQIKWQ